MKSLYIENQKPKQWQLTTVKGIYKGAVKENIQENERGKYSKEKIGMSAFMDGIAAVGTADNIRKGIQNCRMMTIEKKIIYGLRETKYMVINTGKKPKKAKEETVKERVVQETNMYKYLGISG